MKKYLKLLFILVIPVLVSFAVWFSPNLFGPDSYYNLGDTAFPIFHKEYLGNVYFAWVEQGLGRPNLFSAFIPPYFCVFILTLIGLSRNIVNVIWLMLPTAAVGWSTYYLYRSIFQGKYSRLGGVLAAIFAMLPPLYSVIPVWYWALSGFCLSFGALIRGLGNIKNTLILSIVIALGFMMMTLNPRVFYLACWIFALYTFGYYLYVKPALSGIIKFYGKTLLVVLAVNSFWIIPLLYYSLMRHSAFGNRLSGAYGMDVHETFLMQTKNLAEPLWGLRLMTNGGFAGLDYIRQAWIQPFTFFIPISAFLSVLLLGIRNNKKYAPVPVIAVIFLIMSSCICFKPIFNIYRFFWDHLPYFCILNHPGYWFMPLGILYAVMIGASLNGLLFWIDCKKGETSKTAAILKAISVVFLLMLAVFISGGAIIIGRIPAKKVWDGQIYLNHAKSANIPAEYFQLREYLLKNAQPGERVLNVPWPVGGYVSYTWWHAFTMPEIINYISPIPVLAVSNNMEIPVAQILSSLKAHNGTSYRLLKGIGARFVLVHKDYYTVPDVFIFEDSGTIKGWLENNPFFFKAIDNDYFVLYTVKENVAPAVYIYSDCRGDGDAFFFSGYIY